MLKEHFIEDHGVPLYTVGVGGSGGAIQQYVYAQNHPGLLDAAIPQYSYSDMVTQTIHVGDCELLEHYFDVTDRDNPHWRDPEARQAVMGLNATQLPQEPERGRDRRSGTCSTRSTRCSATRCMDRDPASPAPALTECRPAWFGLTPLVLNPTFTNVQDLDKLAQGADGRRVDPLGRPREHLRHRRRPASPASPWDNVGVQYGLEALRERRDHARGVPRPQRPGRQLEGARARW